MTEEIARRYVEAIERRMAYLEEKKKERKALLEEIVKGIENLAGYPEERKT